MSASLEIEKLRSRLRKNHFVAVTGPSGSGKTPLLKDLRKSLEAENEENRGFVGRAGYKWKMVMVTLHRNRNPFRQLARALGGPNTDILVPQGEKVSPLFENRIRRILEKEGDMGLSEIYQQNDHIQDYNLLILFDQFEEIFANSEIGLEQQNHFIQLVLNSTFEGEVVYAAIAFRPPKTARWKHEFPELSEAVEKCEYPVYALNERALGDAITAYYRKESLRSQRKKQKQPGSLRPHKMQQDKFADLVAELYEDSDPLGRMKEIITADYIEETHDGFEAPKVLVRPKTDHGAEVKKSIHTPTPTPVPQTQQRVAQQTPAKVGASAPQSLKVLVQAAEGTYSGLNMIQKRVSQKLFTVLSKGGDAMTLDDISNKVGKFKSIIMELVGEYAANGILQSHPGGAIGPDSTITLSDISLLAHWDRASKWTGITEANLPTPPAVPPTPQPRVEELSRSVPPVAPPPVTPPVPELQTISQAPIPSDGPVPKGMAPQEMAYKGEETFQSLNMLQKRVSQRVFPVLAELLPDEVGAPGQISLADLIGTIGRYEKLIPDVIAAYRSTGVLYCEPDSGPVEPSTEIGLGSYEIFKYWERFGDLVGKVPKDALPVQRKAPALPVSSKDDTVSRQIIPATSTPDEDLTYLVNRVEKYYVALPTIKKRVAQKVLLILAKIPDEADGTPAFMSMGDLITEIGRFENAIGEVAEELKDQSIITPKFTGPIRLDSEIRLSDLKLIDAWERLNKWMYMQWAGAKAAEPAPKKEAEKEKPKIRKKPPKARTETAPVPPPPVQEPPREERPVLKFDDEDKPKLPAEEPETPPLEKKRPKIVIKRRKPK